MGLWKHIKQMLYPKQYWEEPGYEHLNPKLSTQDRLHMIEDMCAKKAPESGISCLQCGTINYSSYVTYEISDENSTELYVPVFQVYRYSKCGHVDSSQAIISTSAVRNPKIRN